MYVTVTNINSHRTVDLLALETYASFLALTSLVARKKFASASNKHVVILLLATWFIFVYRNLWPLATFTLTPKDGSEGWLMWAKLTVLSVTAIGIPVLIPRPYIPLDPNVRSIKHEMLESY